MSNPKSKSTKVIDPEILQLREEHKKRVSDLKNRQKSKLLLATIMEKRLPKMLMCDLEKLSDYLLKTVTPPLPGVMDEPAACCAASVPLVPAPAAAPAPTPTPAPQTPKPVAVQATRPAQPLPRVPNPTVGMPPR